MNGIYGIEIGIYKVIIKLSIIIINLKKVKRILIIAVYTNDKING